MVWRLSAVKEKDVIDVCTGVRLGWFSDLEGDGGRIVAVWVSPKLFGGGRGAVRVPWEDVVCLGPDAILVRGPFPSRESPSCEGGKSGKGFLGRLGL